MVATGTELSDLRKLTVIKLRDRLSKLHLPTNGLKADLVERLHQYYHENATETHEDEESEDNTDSSMQESPTQHAPPSLLDMPTQPPFHPMEPPQSQFHAPPPQSRPPPQQPQAPPSLLSLQTKEPQRMPQGPPSTSPVGQTPVTRTSLQMRLQQMAGQKSEETPPPPQSQPPPPVSQTQPPPLMSQQIQPPPHRPPMMQQSSPMAPPPLGQPPGMPHQQQMPSASQQMGQPPQQMPQPPPLMGQPPPPHIGQPPQQMGQPSQSVAPPPPQLMGHPQQQMGQPQHQMGQPPHQMGQSAQQMGQPPQQMGQPPQQMGQPPQQMGQPPQQMGQPPQQMGQPPQQMGQPPQQMGQPQQPMGQPQQQVAPPQQQMGMPPQLGPPQAQMGQPQISQPPSLMQINQPPQMQDPELQEKIAMQNHMLEQERQQQEQKQRLLEQQTKERLAIQQQALMLQQQQGTPGPPGVGDESPGDLMEKVRQQQIMLEQQKQKERLDQQNKAMMDVQSQAIKKQEDERRRSESDLIRQQQIALMEAQRDEQQQRMREERRGPPTTSAPSSSGGPTPFNPQPSMLHSSGGPPRSLAPPTSSAPSGGIPSLMPPRSSSNTIPPLIPGLTGDTLRPSRPPMPRQDDRGGDRGDPREMKLPSALEKVLAFKDVRAQEVGMTPEELEKLNMPEKKEEEEEDDEIEMVEMEEEDNMDDQDDTDMVTIETTKESKNKRRKKKKKKAKKNRLQQQVVHPSPEKSRDGDIQIEYVQEQLDLDPTDPNYFTFSKIFEAFKILEEGKDLPGVADKVPEKIELPKVKNILEGEESDEDEEDEKPEDDLPKMSKKKLKKLTRLSVAQLKQLVTRPDVVEMHDVTAQDPRLLVHLKATRNTVPVPRHWCFKRKYLQGKRGIEKPPFELPQYIQDTGITEMRQALAEKEDAKNLKAKMREKVRPKMGKIDIDYQKLHDAFFRFQVKPKMTIHGDLYYEGKEFETRLREKKPGNISDDLKTALGMPIGPTSEKVPPPWLIAMQRYGPPPSYPNLKIPGLNGPIPDTTSFGYHAGGWGKPPVDENGKPLYGDVFGTKSGDFEAAVTEEDIDKSHWGELESESESEDESEEESDEEGPDDTGLVTPAEGLVTPSGITSVPVGMETPDMIELRKRRIEDAMDQGGETPALYQVLPEKKSSVGGAMMGSAHIYDVGAAPGGVKKPGEKGATEGIEVALNPEELDLDTAAMQAKYDQTLLEQQSHLEKEDLSDMVAEHAAKQKKRKKKQEDSGKAAKKYKEFKF